MQTALFTGATGFLGSHIARQLLVNDWKVFAITSGASKNRFSDKERDNIVWIENPNEIMQLISNQMIDVFFDCAIQYQSSDIVESTIKKINVERPIEIMNGLALSGQKTTAVLFDSFFSKFDPCQTSQPIYTAQKKELVEHLKENSNKNGLRTIVMRLEHVYGPGDNPKKVLPTICKGLLENVKRISLTNGLSRRDLIYIDDVVSAIMCALASAKESFSLIECGTGISQEMRSVFEILKAITNSRTTLGFNDIVGHDSIGESKANSDILRGWGWRPREDLQTGLKKVVIEIADKR